MSTTSRLDSLLILTPELLDEFDFSQLDRAIEKNTKEEYGDIPKALRFRNRWALKHGGAVYSQHEGRQRFWVVINHKTGVIQVLLEDR